MNQATSTPHDHRLEVLDSTPAWKVYPKDAMFVVSRGRGDAMRGRFRSKESAEQAAAKGNAETWLRLAVNVAPELSNIPGHISHFAQMLVSDAGMSRVAAVKQCEEWAADELACYRAREAVRSSTTQHTTAGVGGLDGR